MSGITNLSAKMKKKLSFADYTVSAEPVPAIPVAPSVARKMYTISKEDAHRLQEIFSKRQKGRPASMSEIMSEAINCLYQNEVKNF